MKRILLVALLAAAGSAYAAWTYSSVREAGSSASDVYLVFDSASERQTDTIYSDTLTLTAGNYIGIAMSMTAMTFADSALDDSASAIVQVWGKMENASLSRLLYTDTLAKDNIDTAGVSDTAYVSFRADLLPFDRLFFATIVSDSALAGCIYVDTNRYNLIYEVSQR